MCVCIGCARSHTIFSVLHVLKRVFMFHDWEVMKVVHVPEVYFFTVICSIYVGTVYPGTVVHCMGYPMNVCHVMYMSCTLYMNVLSTVRTAVIINVCHVYGT